MMKNVCLAEAIDNARISSSLPIGGTVDIRVEVTGACPHPTQFFGAGVKSLGVACA